MQAKISAADRKLLLGAGIVLVALTIGAIAIMPATREKETGVPSSYSNGPAGARAAFLLLRDLGYRVVRWEEPAASLADRGRGAVLILAEPAPIVSTIERRWLRQFVRTGGRIVFCGASIHDFFPEAKVSDHDEVLWEEDSALLPSSFSRDAEHVSLRAPALWGKLDASQLALYGNPKMPSVVLWHVGSGEILWMASADPLTNGGLKKSGNLQFFLNAVSVPSGPPQRVYWDEYFHGQRGTLWAYIARTPVYWGVIQAAFIAAALLFTFSRRSGPIAAPAPVMRLSTLEFVDTLGGLYQRARAYGIAVETSYRRLRLKLTHRLGVPSSGDDAAVAQAAWERLGWDREQLARTLERASGFQAASKKLSGREALVLVQSMGQFTRDLAVRKNDSRENS